MPARYLLASAIAYYILVRAIIHVHGPQSKLATAIGGDWKGKLSPVAYTVGIAVAFQWHWLSLALYVLVALIWLIPDRRIEHALAQSRGG